MTHSSITRFPLTLLHLTDLHFSDATSNRHFWNSESSELQLAPHNRRGLLKSLLRDLRAQKIKPDLVLVTGDLLDRGDPAGVALTVDFLAGLATELDLVRTRIVLVPGNHDVVRDPDPVKQYAHFGQIWTRFYGTEGPAFDPAILPHLRVERFDFARDLGVEIVGFNSCEELDAATNQEHGSVKTGQRDRAEELLFASDQKGLFRIAVMHHHLERPEGIVRDDYSVMDDAMAMIHWLAGHRFQLALHGHQHVDWQSVRTENDWTITIVAGASAGVSNYGRVGWNLQLGYQVIVVDDAASGRRIRREYNLQRREWTAAGRDPAEQRLRFGPETVKAAKGTGTTGTTGSTHAGDITIEDARSRTGGLTAEAGGHGDIAIKRIGVEKDITARTGVRDPKA
jgi:3',5'-cyclic AMP phosphodiesterase CpdA